ncbi:MAG: hypothetical protein SFV53_06570, partial [Rickettsiales bacterium]|nr:hypothetical protein [Rickettsiales bacterium]
EKSDLEKFRLTGIDATSEDTTIAISERHGVRNKQQQDACSVADLEFKSSAATNPIAFFQDANRKIIEAHKFCNNGSTFCSFVFQPNQENILASKITTNNLGDSRLSMIAEDINGEYFSISLTKDHNFENRDFRNFINQPNSDFEIVSERLQNRQRTKIVRKNYDIENVWATVVGSIGDYAAFRKQDEINERKELIGYPFTQFDIAQFSLGEIFSKLNITAKNVNLILACDGVWDLIADDYQLNISDSVLKITKNSPQQNKTNLAEIQQEFNQRLNSRLNPIKDKSLAAFITRKAYKHGSTDNITAEVFQIMKDGRLTINRPIIAAVADGHGESEILDLNNINKSDGAIVAASIVATTMTLAQGKEILGLENERYVADLITAYSQEFGSVNSAITELNKTDSQIILEEGEEKVTEGALEENRKNIKRAFDVEETPKKPESESNQNISNEKTKPGTAVTTDQNSSCCSPISFSNLFGRFRQRNS